MVNREEDGGVAADACPVMALDLLLSIGLNKRTAENALVNAKVTSNLTVGIQEAGVVDGCSKAIGNLLYIISTVPFLPIVEQIHLEMVSYCDSVSYVWARAATKFPVNALVHRPKLLEYIVSFKIKNSAQLDAALSFLAGVGPEDVLKYIVSLKIKNSVQLDATLSFLAGVGPEDFDVSKFEEASGVGVDVSLEEVHSTVNSVMEENMAAILEQRYHINVGNLCGQVRKRHPSADAKVVKEVIEVKLCAILGERMAEDDKKPLKKKKEKPAKAEEETNKVKIFAPPSEEELNPYSIFPAPEENFKVPFTNVVYIERSDFRLKDSKDYYGLAPGKSVLLRYAFPILCTEVIYGDDPDTIVEIRAECDFSKKTKPKGVLHWVAQPSPGVDPLKVEVRLFDKLFLSENPVELDDWLSDLNPNSKEVVPDAFAVPSLANAVLGDKFQFERLGYFAVDTDSTPENLIFNRTITLRDSYTKGGTR